MMKYVVMYCKNYNAFLDDNHWEELSGYECNYRDARLEIQIHKANNKRKGYSYMIQEVETDERCYERV